jgi:hypothetical protein
MAQTATIHHFRLYVTIGGHVLEGELERVRLTEG